MNIEFYIFYHLHGIARKKVMLSIKYFINILKSLLLPLFGKE